MFCKIHFFTIHYYLLPAPKIESISEECIVKSEKVKIDILLSKNVDFWCERRDLKGWETHKPTKSRFTFKEQSPAEKQNKNSHNPSKFQN